MDFSYQVKQEIENKTKMDELVHHLCDGTGLALPQTGRHKVRTLDGN